MAAGAIFAGVAAAGSLINTVAQFWNAGKMKKAVNANYKLEMDSIEQQRLAYSDQIQQFNKQGESFMGTQRVAAATSGVTGASVSGALSTSRANLLKDASRMQEQAAMNVESAKRRAEINKQAGNVASASAGMQAFGSLLTGASSTYAAGFNWGVWGTGGGGGAGAPGVKLQSPGGLPVGFSGI